MRGEGREEKGGGEEGEEERGGEGGEGRGEEAFLVMWPRRFSSLNPPLIIGIQHFVYDRFHPTNLQIILYENTRLKTPAYFNAIATTSEFQIHKNVRQSGLRL